MTPLEPGRGYPRKRDKTRRRLQSAALDVIARDGHDGATVGEIVAVAGVASGTFYNHFPSLADLYDSLIDLLASGIELGGDTLAVLEHDPAMRVLAGTRQLLVMATDEPRNAAAFVSFLAAVPAFRQRVRRVIGSTVRGGIESGRFPITDQTATADALLGAVVQWMRSQLLGETDGVGDRSQLRIALAVVGIVDGADELIDRLDVLDPVPVDA